MYAFEVIIISVALEANDTIMLAMMPNIHFRWKLHQIEPINRCEIFPINVSAVIMPVIDIKFTNFSNC